MVLRSAVLVAAFLLLAAAPTGGVYVTTLPAGADIWIDGTYVGHSPVVVDALAPGRHTIDCSRTGWKAHEFEVTVVAGTMATASAPLQRAGGSARPLAGSLLVHRNGSVRAVVVDGVTVTPGKGAIVAAAGVHQVVVENAHGEKSTREVTVYPETRTDVVLRDAEVDHTIVVAPVDDYLKDGELQRTGARITIRHGKHRVSGELGSNLYRFDGASVAYDAAPAIHGKKIYLPLELLNALTAQDRDR